MTSMLVIAVGCHGAATESRMARPETAKPSPPGAPATASGKTGTPADARSASAASPPASANSEPPAVCEAMPAIRMAGNSAIELPLRTAFAMWPEQGTFLDIRLASWDAAPRIGNLRGPTDQHHWLKLLVKHYDREGTRDFVDPGVYRVADQRERGRVFSPLLGAGSRVVTYPAARSELVLTHVDEQFVCGELRYRKADGDWVTSSFTARIVDRWSLTE